MQRLIPVIVLVASTLASGVAYACSPAPNYWVSLDPVQTPDCLVLQDADSYESGALLVSNNCDDEATVKAVDCNGCGGPITVQPGSQDTFRLEGRILEEGTTSVQTVSWEVGDDSGEFNSTVTYNDNSDACDGFDNACSTVLTQPAPLTAAWLAVLILVGLRRRA